MLGEEGDGPVARTFVVTEMRKYICMKVWNFCHGASCPSAIVANPRAGGDRSQPNLDEYPGI